MAHPWLGIGALVAGLALLAHTALDPDGWGRLSSTEIQLEELRSDNEKLTRRVEQLRAEIDALKTRPDVQRRVIRDELNYLTASDVVLELRSER